MIARLDLVGSEQANTTNAARPDEKEAQNVIHAGSGADTIFAIGTGTGRAAIAVLRLSGPATVATVKAIAGRLPEPRVATLATFKDPSTLEPIDSGLVLFFPAPHSFTGEDCAEFHVHGGRAVVLALINAIGAAGGARVAEPGEFTRRALLNGKIDLSQVEGLGDLIEAETEWQRRQALRQMQGALGRQAAQWRSALLEAAALVEAEIDFSDEADVPEGLSLRVADIVRPILSSLQTELAAAHSGELIREGVTIVIAGPPNAGKSSLLNALARRDVAIVSALAGTTRDAIEVRLDLSGCAVTLIDTAGLRDSEDAIEQIGVSRAVDRARNAELILWLSECDRPAVPDERLGSAEIWRILTKSDLLAAPPVLAKDALCLSSKTGSNLDVLLQRLGDWAGAVTGAGHAGLITRERHHAAIRGAVDALRCIEINPSAPVEILAEDLRAALFALERLIGRVDVEDILNDIFSRFCIGK
jgi:tRNA modification GTPase